MIVDDDIATGKLLSYQLRSAGYDVIYLQDGLQALQRVLIEQPDLILLDVIMPHVSGWDVCREVRTCSAVPVIMLTGKDADDDVVTGLRAGADDYVTKPFNMTQLQARIEAVLRRAQTRASVPIPQEQRPVVAERPSQPAQPVHEAVPARRLAHKAAQSMPPAVPVVALASAQASRLSVSSARSVPIVSAPRAQQPTPPHAMAAQPPMRLGQQLRLARQERGLSLYQAERLCHVRWDYLQALEQENWEYAPRARVRSALIAYAALLHVSLDGYRQKQAARPARFEAHQIVAIILTVLLILAAGLLFL
jgi:CheY-like chemotaxis protein